MNAQGFYGSALLRLCLAVPVFTFSLVRASLSRRLCIAFIWFSRWLTEILRYKISVMKWFSMNCLKRFQRKIRCCFFPLMSKNEFQCWSNILCAFWFALVVNDMISFVERLGPTVNKRFWFHHHFKYTDKIRASWGLKSTLKEEDLRSCPIKSGSVKANICGVW